ncbi:MAG TPA: TetR/AcrR family transcriptional regulator C-terminal domain-containing protein [Streptosporangiaceae bacterium]
MDDHVARTDPQEALRDGGSWASAAGVPDAPWQLGTKPATSRAPLTRDAIVDAALRVLDAEGVDGLSMRRVGEELGTGAASIYWHVKNKEQLLQLIFERVTAAAELPPPDPARWQDQLRELSMRMRTMLNNHRDLARISLGRIPSGPTIALLSEWLFTLLVPVGIPDTVIAYLGDLFGLYVGAFTYEESLGSTSFTGPDLTPEQFLGMMKDYLLSLPEDRFPHTRRTVGLMLDYDIDGRYAFGIDLMIRGLETYATKTPD